jgi:hypothetical protein
MTNSTTTTVSSSPSPRTVLAGPARDNREKVRCRVRQGTPEKKVREKERDRQTERETRTRMNISYEHMQQTHRIRGGTGDELGGGVWKHLHLETRCPSNDAARQRACRVREQDRGREGGREGGMEGGREGGRRGGGEEGSVGAGVRDGTHVCELTLRELNPKAYCINREPKRMFAS